MNAIFTIARASIIEHSRRRIILFFLVLAVGAAGGLIYLTLNQELISSVVGATVGLGTLASIGFLSVLATLATVAVSMNNIGRPFSDGEAMLLLSRPMSRWQYAAGRLLASVVVAAGLCFVMASLMQGVDLFDGRSSEAGLWGHWGTTAFNLTLLAAMTTMMSALVDAPILAGLISYFLYSSAGIVSSLYLLVEGGRMRGLAATAIRIAWYITPKTLTSPLGRELAEARTDAAVSASLLPSTTSRLTWAACYLLVVFGVTYFAVNRKDL